ncbi:hypothetical protein QUF70_04855 [Desulfobacterales bacterium HSG17]|nr:hypothetical protein [Desulfobacterales bacterium HSG17]
MPWNVKIKKKAVKVLQKLPVSVQEQFKSLAMEMRVTGPVQESWPNYGKIRGVSDCHHCHIKKGKPTYVVVWKVIEKNSLEVIYIGTHEKAKYQRLC